MTTTHLSRPWYCLDALVDDWRTVYQHGGDLTVHRTLKIVRSIIVNLGIITITMYGLVETSAAPTWIAMLGISTLALYNGVEVADYAALAQALKETQGQDSDLDDRDSS